MKVTFDPEADAMYIYFSDKKKSTRTEEVRGDLIVDYSGNDMIGLEILDVSKKLTHKDLKSVTFTLPVFRNHL